MQSEHLKVRVMFRVFSLARKSTRIRVWANLTKVQGDEDRSKHMLMKDETPSRPTARLSKITKRMRTSLLEDPKTTKRTVRPSFSPFFATLLVRFKENSQQPQG